jgi:hypothetical protein
MATKRTKTAPSATAAHRWEFRARFRPRTFGWKSQPAIARVRQAVAEIKKVAKKDAVIAAEGAVLFLERVSPALEQVDSSSGAIGSAVNRAIEELAPLIAGAPADATTRDDWLERLFQAHADDGIPYIELLGDQWGELCASSEVASAWADRLIGITRMALSPDPNLRGHFHGTFACLAALFRAQRFAEILDLVRPEALWHYQRWVVRALAAQGRKAEAMLHAESCRGPYASDPDVDGLCEQILLSEGLVDDAYARYAVTANRSATYLGTFRAVAKKYPHKSAAEILTDLVKSTPGDEGKWFAAAKDAGHFDEAIRLANSTPCDPKTLARAARDHAGSEPAFALEAGLAALDWLAQGYGYEVTSADVRMAYDHAMRAASALGRAAELRARVREITRRYHQGDSFVARVLGRELAGA